MLPDSPFLEKIKDISSLAEIVSELKKEGKKVVQAHGVFDLVHPAHLYHFERAKKLGDVLMVSLVPDAFVRKGPERPFFDEDTRMKWLAHCGIVDFVVLCTDETPHAILEKVKPSIYVKGESNQTFLADSQSGISLDKKVCEEHGIQLMFTPEMSTHSSDMFEKIRRLS